MFESKIEKLNTVYSFKGVLNCSDVIQLLKIDEDSIKDEYTEEEKLVLPNFNWLQYSQLNKCWQAGVQLLSKIKNNEELEMEVRLCNPNVNFKFPSFMPFEFKYEEKSYPSFILPEVENLMLLQNKNNTLSRRRLSPKDYERYLKRHLEAYEDSFYEKYETENCIYHKVWCNMPHSEYEKVSNYESIGFNGNNILFEDEQQTFEDFQKDINAIAKEGLLNPIPMYLSCCGSIVSVEDKKNILIAELLGLPHIPCCITFCLPKNGSCTVSQGKYLDWSVNKIKEYLKPDVVFMTNNIYSPIVSNSSSDTFAINSIDSYIDSIYND